MTAAMYQLGVVSLGRGDVAQTRSAAHDVYDHSGQFGAGDVRKTFLHQADARTGAGGHGAQASTGSTINHVDCAEFALGLNETTPQLGHAHA